MADGGEHSGGGRMVLLACLVAGAGVGWVVGRQSVDIPPPPPPVQWVNPLGDCARGERLVHDAVDGVRDEYFVEEADDATVLLRITKTRPGGAVSTRSLRVSRNSPGVLIVLEGDLPAEAIDAGMRSFVVHRMFPDPITAGGVARDTWCIEGQHLHQGALRIWVDPQAPVHGVVKVESDRGVVLEIAP